MVNRCFALAVACLILGPIVASIPGAILAGPSGVESTFFRGSLVLGAALGIALSVLLSAIGLIGKLVAREKTVRGDGVTKDHERARNNSGHPTN